MTNQTKHTKELREKLAELAHEQWSGWMEYLFNKCGNPQKGEPVIIPPEFADRWGRQMNTPYSELSEEEKDSDRKEADKFIKVFEKTLTSREEEIYGKIEARINLVQMWIEKTIDQQEKNGYILLRDSFKELLNSLKRKDKK